MVCCTVKDYLKLFITLQYILSEERTCFGIKIHYYIFVILTFSAPGYSDEMM